MSASVEMAARSLTQCRAPEREVCHTMRRLAFFFGQAALGTVFRVPGVSVNRGRSLRGVCHGSETLYRWPLVQHVYRTLA